MGHLDSVVHSIPQLRPKVRSSDIVFSMKLFILIVGYTAGILLATMDNLGLVMTGCILLGLWQAHAVELQHQVIHGLGYRNNRLNNLTGILLGLPMLVSYSGYRSSHLRHHRNLGTAKNEEFFDYGDQYGAHSITFLQMIARLSMTGHYLSFVQSTVITLSNGRFAKESPEVSRRMKREHLAMLAFIAILVFIGITRHEWRPLLYWACSFILIASPVHALIEMPEHYKCDLTTTDVFRNTRSIRSNQFWTWYTNANNFHVEHHLAPGLPMEMLPDIFEQNSGKHSYTEPTYRSFFGSVVRDMFRKTPRSL